MKNTDLLMPGNNKQINVIDMSIKTKLKDAVNNYLLTNERYT